MVVNLRKEANNFRNQNNSVVSGTIESNNHAEHGVLALILLWITSLDKHAVSLAMIRKFNQVKYVSIQD